MTSKKCQVTLERWRGSENHPNPIMYKSKGPRTFLERGSRTFESLDVELEGSEIDAGEKRK